MSKRDYKPSPCFGSFTQEGASGKCKIDVKTQDGKKRKVPLGCHKAEEGAARALAECVPCRCPAAPGFWFQRDHLVIYQLVPAQVSL